MFPTAQFAIAVERNRESLVEVARDRLAAQATRPAATARPTTLVLALALALVCAVVLTGTVGAWGGFHGVHAVLAGGINGGGDR
jgi:hypothetical protein